MTKPCGNTGDTSSDENRLIHAYVSAMKGINQLASPEHIKDILVRLTWEPSPADVFKDEDIPRLKKLWLDARLARDRYLANLAHEVFLRSPRIEDTKAGRVA